MFVRILKQSFHRQRRRKSLAALAVIAGMAVASAMLTLRVNLGDDLSAELRHIGANIVITPAADSLPITLDGVDLRPAGSGALLDERDLPAVKTIFWRNNIVALAPILDTQVSLDGRRVQAEGAYLDALRRINPAWSVAGSWPAGSGNGVLIGRNLGGKVGDRILLDGRPAVVTGIVTTGGAEDNEVIAPLALVQAIAGVPGKYRRALVSAVTKPEDAFARRSRASMTMAEMDRWMCSPYAVTIAQQLQDALPGSVATVVRPVADSEGVILSQLRLLLWFITILALAASGLAISGAMTASVIERRGEIALMKAVGAQDSAIGALFFSEAALLGLGGGALGYLLGEWLATAIAYHVLGHSIAWKPALAPLVLVLAALVALLGSLHPLRQAMRVEPAVALRGEA
ncbi:MAG TPA: FtsX-like permease family protein [Terriglobales bacterium]|nr:FtsX-like permease family protein [Terriglobales bacterium]